MLDNHSGAYHQGTNTNKCSDSTGSFYNACDDMSNSYFVRVVRDPSLPESCEEYTLSISNGEQQGGTDTCEGTGALFSDDFESGTFDSSKWKLVSGYATVQSTYAANGTYAAKMSGNNSPNDTIETVEIDASACTSIAWSYNVQRGPESPDAGDYLRLEIYDGLGSWSEVDYMEGNGTTETSFSARSGTIPAPPPFTKFRFVSRGTSSTYDHYHIDDVVFDCRSSFPPPPLP